MALEVGDGSKLYVTGGAADIKHAERRDIGQIARVKATPLLSCKIHANIELQSFNVVAMAAA